MCSDRFPLPEYLLGMFMIILLGDIDLSVGSMYAFIGVISAIVFKTTESTCLTLIVA